MTTTYATNHTACDVINTRKGYTVRTNSGKLISHHADKASAKAAARQYGNTRCYIQYFRMRPIDYLYEAYCLYREKGLSAQEATNYARCAVRV